MVQVAKVNTLRIDRFVEFGAYLDDGAKGILLPNRFLPKGVDVDDEVDVFIYHDGDGKLIATNQTPLVQLGEIGYLKCVSNTKQGSFMDWGLMKDLFVPKSKEHVTFYKDEYYFIQPYIDEQTGRVAGNGKIDMLINNDNLTVSEKDPVHLRIYRESDLGYVCIINHQHEGVLHTSDVFKRLYIGDAHQGYIKKIYADTNKIDVMLGKAGYEKVNDESSKILDLLNENNGFLPYHDKSDPDAIHQFFGMSKKVFKMTVGKLYKEKLITIDVDGIRKV
jgi:uncharacterized protein